MNAMMYEKLMKMAYQCHRNGRRGVNAEVYRNMDRGVHELQYPETSLHSEDQLNYIAKIAMSEIRGYVEGAVRKAVTHIKNLEDKDALHKLLLTIPAGQCEKQVLDHVIRTAIDILAKNNIVVP